MLTSPTLTTRRRAVNGFAFFVTDFTLFWTTACFVAAVWEDH